LRQQKQQLKYRQFCKYGKANLLKVALQVFTVIIFFLLLTIATIPAASGNSHNLF